MHKIHFPSFTRHHEPAARDVNALLEIRATVGDRAADWVADKVGSWGFLITQTILLTVWAALNVTAWVKHWDPYPFTLMNLMLSMQAAYAAPVIMMSQNRKADRDRLEAHNDFVVDVRSEENSERILEILEAQNQALLVIHQMLAEKFNGNAEAQS